MSWPESVPVLTAADFCRGTSDGPNNTHCLIGHTWNLVGGDSPIRFRVFDAIRRSSGSDSVKVFNDDTRNSLADLANVWNKAMCSLGYTEIHEVDA